MTDIDIRVGDVISIEHSGIIVDDLEVDNCGIGFVGAAVKLGKRHYTLAALAEAGWKVIKNRRRLRPLPTDPGWYVGDYAASPSGRITVELLGTGEWVDNTDSRYLKPEWVAELANLTRLVPAASERESTIREVLGWIENKFYGHAGSRILELTREHFGVTP